MIDSAGSANRRLRNSATSKTGLSARTSRRTNAASSTAAPAKAHSVIGESHPLRGPSMIDHTRVVMPASESTSPGTSSRPCDLVRDSGSTSAAATSTASANGTFIQNTECHVKCSSSHPPAVGPMATANPAMAVHTAIAAPRAFGEVKVAVSTASVAGNTAAANTPITARAATTVPTPVDSAPPTDTTATPARPIIIIRRRPYLSPRCPQASRNPANVSV